MNDNEHEFQILKLEKVSYLVDTYFKTRVPVKTIMKDIMNDLYESIHNIIKK